MVKFRKSLGFIAGILMFVVLVFVSITWADSNGVWNRAEDMRPGIIGGDENSGDFTFNSSLFVLNGNVAIGINVSNGKFRVVDTYSGSVFSQVLIKGGSYGFQEIFSDGLSDDGNVPYLSFHRGNQIGWQQGLVGNNFVIAWGSGANTDNMFANQIFTITNDSKVGIGTLNPRYSLDVSGQMISSGIGSQYIMQETDNPINVNDLWHMSYNSGNFAMEFEEGINPGIYKNRFFINSTSGNIGVGTVNPLHKLHIKNGELLIEETAADQAAHLFLRNSDHTWQIDSDSGPLFDRGLRFDYEPIGGADSTKMIIKTNGNVGINTRMPTAKLEVNGDIKAHNLYSNGDKVATENYVNINGGSLSSCNTVSNTKNWPSGPYKTSGSAANRVEVTCPATFTMTGGGCTTVSHADHWLEIDRPTANGWECYGEWATSTTAYARCCK